MNEKLENVKRHGVEGSLLTYLEDVEARLTALEAKKAPAKRGKDKKKK